MPEMDVFIGKFRFFIIYIVDTPPELSKHNYELKLFTCGAIITKQGLKFFSNRIFMPLDEIFFALRIPF